MMNRITKSGKGYIGYDYKTITVPANKAVMYIDNYKNFGWELEDKETLIRGDDLARLTFKQDRKILNKMELTRLERHFEACMEEIDSLEKSKYALAVSASISVGILGVASMVGAVFAFRHVPPLLVIGILLSLIALAGWISPIFIHKKLFARSLEKINPLIEQKYDEIYDICEKGFNLIYK